jgi:gliding motility-associated-like protein
MKFFLRIFSLIFVLITVNSQSLKASHGLPIVNNTYTVGPTGVTVAGFSDPATCGSGPYWMQTKLACDPSLFANIPPDACLSSYLQNWTGAGTSFNSFPWFNSILNVASYNLANSWPDQCVLEPYNNIFIPFADLCPGKVYYFATRELVTGSGNVGAFGAINSFTVPGSVPTCTPGYISSNPATSPSSPSCGGNVLLTINPPNSGCKEKLTPIPGCSTCDTIVWWGPSGVIAVNTLTLMVSPSATTTYTVGWDTCSVINKVGCATCPFNKTITVYVANTNAMFAGPPTLCAGSTANFTAVLPSLTDMWSVSPTTSVTPSSGIGPNFSAVFDDAGIFVVTHQSMNGACMAIQTQTIIITPGITSSVSTSGGGCAGVGGVGNATVSVSTSTVGLTYSWAPSGGTSNVETNIPFNTTYTLTMSNGGCVVTKTVQISNNPPPTITSFSITQPTCFGLSDGIVSANLTGGNPPFSFTWSPTITQTTQTVTGVAAGVYSVNVIDNNGCATSNAVSVSQPSSLTLMATPSATLCSGNTTTITSAASGGTPVYSYTWNPGNVSSSSAVITPSSNTQYTCTVIDNNGCTTTQTVDIAVSAPLTVAATISSICASTGSVTLTPSITSVGNGGPYTYLWSNGAITSSISVPSNSIASIDNYTVTISDGCTIPSATAVFTVVTTTAPSVSSFNVASPLCNAQLTGTVSVNLVGGTAPYSFTWSPTITQTTQTVTGVGAGSYTVLVLDNSGCSTSSVVTVTEPTALSLTTSSSATICFGNTSTLTSSVSGGTPVYSYTWNPGNVNTANAIVSPTSTTQYTCTIKDLNGCTTTQTTSINVGIPLTVSATAYSLCIGDKVVLTPSITSAGNGGPYTYVWTTGATSPTIQVTSGSSAGTINYGVSVSDGCSTPNGIASFTVVTNPNPTANIVADSLIGNAPLTVNFTDLGSGGNSFNWNFGNGNTSAVQNPAGQIYPNGGTYSVTYTVTNTFGCHAYDTLSIVVIDLIPELIVPNVFTPNGDRANDLFAVKGVNITSFECSIFNRWGKLVFSSSDVMNSWDGKINGSPADEGTYFYMIKASGAVGGDIKKQGYVSLFR